MWSRAHGLEVTCAGPCTLSHVWKVKNYKCGNFVKENCGGARLSTYGCVGCAKVCHLHSLRSLNLSQNHLRKLPKLLAAYLRDLAVLDLSRNCFRRIPPVLASLHNLRHLSLADNPDLEVPCDLTPRHLMCVFMALLASVALSLEEGSV